MGIYFSGRLHVTESDLQLNRFGMKASVVCRVLLAMLITGCSRAAPDEPLTIDYVRFFHVGGDDVRRPSTGIFGNIEDRIRAYQLAVLSLVPATDSPGTPVLMLPGFGIAADTYLETPDGRPGWAMNFVRRGHPVYLVEPSHTTRSGIDSGFYLKPDEKGTTSQLFSWGAAQVWQRWGLGPEYAVPFDNSRFPTEHYDRVVAGFTSIETDRIAGEHTIFYQLESNVAALTALLEDIGPSVLLAHSASGVAAFEVAMRRPDLVRAIIAVEPVGCPATDGDKLGKIAILSLFADHMQVRPQMLARREECRQTVAAAQARDAVAAFYDLPAMGINGNSHLMMFENNSSDLAQMMINWLAALPPD